MTGTAIAKEIVDAAFRLHTKRCRACRSPSYQTVLACMQQYVVSASELAVHTLLEWSVERAVELRYLIHQLRETMKVAGELPADDSWSDSR